MVRLISPGKNCVLQSGFELLSFWNLFATQYTLSSHVFTIAGTAILRTKQIPEHVTGRAGDQDEETS